MRNFILLTAAILIMVSCKTETKQTNTDSEASYTEALNKINKSQPKMNAAIALQSENSGSYSYVLLKEDGKEFWAAVSARDIEIGGTYYYNDSFEMKNFHSKGLDKDFESIWFINDFYAEQAVEKQISKDLSQETPVVKTEEISVEAAEGGHSLAYVFENKTELKDKSIIIKGQVVKFSPSIMGLNWIHIQDGTDFNGLNDLTVTSAEDIRYKIGDIVTFKGILHLNKDFGSGYKYDFIVEEAVKQ